ncbi:hypothetical protein C8R44DRAFT_884984 [Mycena epipterygia]|nr:hypothetical protein C8R44DRAFT_884984 [Mycena epipterygia]
MIPLLLKIPQELLDAILCDADDQDTLKACSLVSSRLRWASQHILLRSLTLRSSLCAPNYDAVVALLGESQHIQEYVTNLTIQFPSPYSTRTGNLRQVLAKLSNVRRCMITGANLREARWSCLTPKISSILVQFISRQKLKTLSFSSIQEIPSAVLLSLITSVSTLSFSFVCTGTITHAPPAVASDNSFPSAFLLQASPLHHLVLHSGSDYISKLLCHSGYAPLTMNIRHLSIVYHQDMSLIKLMARKLTQLRIDCTHANRAEPSYILLLSLLPSLCSLEITLLFRDHAAPWFIDTISDVLTSTRRWTTIEEKIITYSPTKFYHPPDLIYESVLSAIQTKILAHLMLSRV